jgi:hypothetical protein
MYNPQMHITNGELSVRAMKGAVELKYMTGPHDSGSHIVTLTDDMIKRIVEAQRVRQLADARNLVLDHGTIDELFTSRHP